MLALLLTLGTTTAIWLDRQALSNRGWTDTSAGLIENPRSAPRSPTRSSLQLFPQANVDHRLSSTLGPLAGPAETQLHRSGRSWR